MHCVSLNLLKYIYYSTAPCMDTNTHIVRPPDDRSCVQICYIRIVSYMCISNHKSIERVQLYSSSWGSFVLDYYSVESNVK